MQCSCACQSVLFCGVRFAVLSKCPAPDRLAAYEGALVGKVAGDVADGGVERGAILFVTTLINAALMTQKISTNVRVRNISRMLVC